MTHDLSTGAPGTTIQRRKARSTGTSVELYRNDTDEDGPYVTLCEDHGYLVCHGNLRDARSWAPHPEDWCGVCSGAEVE